MPDPAPLTPQTPSLGGLIRSTDFLSPSKLPNPPPPRTLLQPKQTTSQLLLSQRNGTKSPCVSSDIAAAYATKPPAQPPILLVGTPNKFTAKHTPKTSKKDASLLLTSFLNNSSEMSFEHAQRSENAENYDLNSSTASSDEFLPQELIVATKVHLLEKAGLRICNVLLRAYTRHLLRAFMKFKFNHDHVRVSLVCGVTILGKVNKFVVNRAVASRFRHWATMSLLEGNRCREIVKRRGKVLHRLAMRTGRNNVRISFGRWRQVEVMARRKEKDGRYLKLQNSHKQVSTEKQDLEDRCDSLGEINADLGERTVLAEDLSFDYKQRRVKSNMR